MGGLIRRRSRFAARRAILIVFALTTLALLAGSALEARSLIVTSLDREQATEAGREARLAADLGLTEALSSGGLSRRDLRLAATDYAAARRVLPLTGLMLWSRSGKVLLARGSGLPRTRSHQPPAIVRAAFAADLVRIGYATSPGVGAIVQAAVPLGHRGLGIIAEFTFSRRGVDRAANAANDRIYLLTGIAALIIFLLVLPLLARLARSVPLPIDTSRREAINDLKRGLAHRELVVHYQPKIELASGSVIGVEALVRWNHPRRGLLGPAGFLPTAAVAPDLLEALTAQVLDRAMTDCARWQEAGTELAIAVNVATEVLLEGPLIGLVRDALEAHELDPRFLTLELTEDALMEHGVVTEQLTELRRLGVGLSIDDFGTGHSSLARLHLLPFDELKLDGSFIARIANDDRDLRILRHIIELGLDLDLRVVAEGVEDKHTLEILRGLGCTTVQGYYVSRPLAEDDLCKWLGARPIVPPPIRGRIQ